ncbi:MAG: hypothetical protein ABIA59_04970, partial [Candidatus Latescibacterota bacterium]
PLPQLAVIVPPAPANFTVTSPAPGIFNLTWDIDDPAVVSYYRLYYRDPIFFQLTFADTTASTSLQFDVGVAITDILWGVSSVTIENVEGGIVYASVGNP